MKKIAIWIIILVVIIGVIVWHQLSSTTENEEDIIKIGVIFPLTGGAAHIGELAKRGVILAAEDINAAGGIKGKKIKLIIEDVGMVPLRAMDAYRKLKDMENVRFFISMMSNNSIVLAKEIDKEKGNALLMTSHVNIEDFTKISPYVFRVNTTTQSEVLALYDYLIKRLGFKNPAIYTSNDDYGKEVAERFIKLLGKPPVAYETFERGQLDHRITLLKIKAQNPDVCLFIGNELTVPTAIKQAKEAELSCQYVATTPIADSASLTLAGEAANGMLYHTTPFADKASNSPKQLQLRKAYKEKYGKEAEYSAVNPYAAIEMLAAGMNLSPSLEPDDVKEALLSMKDVETIYGSLSFNADGDVQLPLMLFRYQDGQSVPVEAP